jgi:predicted GNAT family N-acyltransferase
MNGGKFSIRICDWDRARADARLVRERVFVREQGVPLELEWDEWDAPSMHALAYAAGVPVGTGRLLPDGHIGRMAVLKEWRGTGVGGALLESLVALARRNGHALALLNAQTYAAGFYRRYGFLAEGPEFMEADIPHVLMKRSLRED